ncbi:hypothetical protein BJ878DRAFT_584386 [Calycina marina]|uniref:Uncharacterized protein n=1 Tax=Calycina marina TaxID=1763456 RepID=A0A9P8CCD2_9HELO|nr:hypothetical protein BJ878DRAFT_584386 [Calycina marina]
MEPILIGWFATIAVSAAAAFKDIYYKLHCLEQFPEVLPQAKRLLLFLLEETSSAALQLPKHGSILSVRSFSREAIIDFQTKRDMDIGKQWEEYNMRRKRGGRMELFSDRDEAIWWLKQISPVKYVDGAWLGHIGKVTTPFALRKTMKGAWQILSEELGDGELEKNHVYLYHELIKTLAPELLTAEEPDFGHPRHGLEVLPVWKSAVAQLLVSLFPAEFLPEILGFNLHFEAISMDTLKAGKELKEVGIDPYYFILHVSIDNADSGHTAIALELVCEYMNYVRKTNGAEGENMAWKRIQAGYLLSSGLPGTAICPSRRAAEDDSDSALSPIEAQVIKIFRAKSQVVHGIHCNSKLKIGGRSVADWLNPAALTSETWQRALLNGLTASKYWICRGDSNNSRFMKELRWKGRMFGSFTHDEYEVLTHWIDSLPNLSQALEGPGSSQHMDHDSDILSGYPAVGRVASKAFHAIPVSPNSKDATFSFEALPSLVMSRSPCEETFIPLWLSHPCLLQGFVSVPFRTNNIFACNVIKILRAQGGFDIEQVCVAGMAELRRPNSLGLAGIGMNMMSHQDARIAALPSLNDVLQIWPSEFVVWMLHQSMRPIGNRAMLIGMATAFGVMHSEIARTGLPCLTTEDQLILRNISQRELQWLEVCWAELQLDATSCTECCHGYIIAREEIQRCFTKD